MKSKPRSSRSPINPISKIADMTRSRMSAFQLSQTKNPMPMPPDSISPATITTQAMPRLNRNPVRMCGSENGIRMRRADPAAQA